MILFNNIAQAKVVITASEAVIGDRVLMLKKNLDEALTDLSASATNTIEHVLVAMGENNGPAPTYLAKDIHLEKVCSLLCALTLH